MNTLLVNKLWKCGNVEMCLDKLLYCRCVEMGKSVLITELVTDVTVEKLKHVLSPSGLHPTPVGKSGGLGLEV